MFIRPERSVATWEPWAGVRSRMATARSVRLALGSEVSWTFEGLRLSLGPSPLPAFAANSKNLPNMRCHKTLPFLSVTVGLLSLVSISFATSAQNRSQTAQPYPTVAKSVAWITNVPYVTDGGLEQQLDLYIPTDQKGEPLIVFVHGGGWEHGDKAGDSINPNNLQWLWQGYAMASINYRLIQHAAWPAQIEDCKAAIRWLKAHADEYGYDPDRIGVVGESAGGHLVCLLVTTSRLHKFDVGENLNYSSDVTCAVDLFGVSDFTRFSDSKLAGSDPHNKTERAREASPITYVHKDQPPMLVVHGTDDKLVPYEQAVLLADAMDKAGARYHFHTVVGGGHNPYFGLGLNPKTGEFDVGGGGIGLFEDPAVEPLIVAFLRYYLLERHKDGFRG
jgi:acetyl esterase/lipase